MQASPGPDWNTKTPLFHAPPGSVDCHAHLFGPIARYPYSSARNYTPVESGVDAYIRMLDVLHIDRAVVVQGSAQGTDNTILMDAIAANPGRLLGIAVVEETIDDATLKLLAAAGLRGIRLSNTLEPRTPLAMLEDVARRVAPLGMHLQMHLGHCHDLLAFERQIASSPVPILIDHMASVTADDGLDAPGFQMLLRLMTECDHVWTKVAAFYRRTRSGAPTYDDMRPFAQALVRNRPDRVVWGTNWPHPVYEGSAPNDGDLLDLFAAWFPDKSDQQRILVSNPELLFGFDSVAV